MKILHAGNLVNIGYYFVRELRKYNINAELLMHKDPGPTDDPLNYDPELKGKYPEWIKIYDLKGSWKIQIMKLMRSKKYDLIHAYVEAPIFAQFSSRPFIAHVLGSDLRELAFTKSLRGFLLRRAYKKAKVVLFYEPKLLPYLKKLGVKRKIFFPYTPNDVFYPKNVRLEELKDKFVIFHPARADWKIKGNDILIKGFAKFVKNNPNGILMIVEHGKNLSKDMIRNRELVNELKIIENVKFLKGPLNTTDLAYYYNYSDVVADQFALGEGGVIYLEAMACRKPVLINLDQSEQKKVFDEPPPIVNAKNSDEISDCLEKLKDKKIREEIGNKSYEWVKTYLDKDKSIKKLIKIYEKILNHESLDEFMV